MIRHSDGGGKLLEQLHGVLTDELKIPLPKYSEKNPLAREIHNDLDALASSYPDFVDSFIAEMRHFVKATKESGSLSIRETQKRFHESLRGFLDRIGTEDSSRPTSPSDDAPEPGLYASPASSNDSFATARSRKSPMSPQKRKISGEDLEDTPSRRRREVILNGWNNTNGTNNGTNGSCGASNGVLPTTPPKRHQGHTGATERMNRMRVDTPPSLPTPISLSPAPHNVSNGLHNSSVFRPRSSDWDPEWPIPAPSAAETWVEVVPRNSYQAWLNSKGINFYVQWELERHVHDNPTVTWDDIKTDDLNTLVGSSSDIIPRIPSFVRSIQERKYGRPPSGQLKGDAYSVPSPAMCSEMDIEEASIVSGDLRGLGNSDPRWPYGGKLVFAVSVEPGITRPMKLSQNGSARSSRPSAVVNGGGGSWDNVNPFEDSWPFSFKLRQIDQPGKSTRLARRFGSRRILSIRFGKLPKHVRPQLFLMLRGRALVLFGRVFRMLYVATDNDSGVAVETNEQAPGYPPLQPPLMPSLLDLIQGYNFLEAKPGQAMAKWSSRLQLLLSDSIPGVRVAADAIEVVDDIVCASAKDPSDPATTEILTDGCGLMSQALAQRICQQPAFKHLSRRPYSIQMRIGGAKGLLSIMNAAQEEFYAGKDIVLRHSMVKSVAKTEFATDPSLLTLDILRVDSMKVGSSLSAEPLIVMEHNGVPREVLLNMAQNSLDEVKYYFYPYPHPTETEEDCSRRLIAATFRFGGVGSDRNRREAAAMGKSAKVTGLVHGFINDEPEKPKADDISAEEKLYEMLLAGFKPTISDDGCIYAATKLRLTVTSLVSNMVQDLKIRVDQSATAFIVPDTFGILAPDEVYVSFASEEPQDPNTGHCIPVLQGECLVFRYPCKLPTDVRKFRAVNRPELSHLRDCIVLSANSELCKASPASFLGGGDYDGDTATVIWDPALVQPFTNAPDEQATPPAGFESNFVKQVASVRDVLDACGDNEAMLVTNLQHFLLGGLHDDGLTGKYSTLHDTSVYTRGCGHPETMRLAHMFCAVLDARKSGLSVPPHIQRSDKAKNPGDVMWRLIKKGKDDNQQNIIYAQRPLALGTFIMDDLLKVLQAKQHEVLAAFPDPRVVERATEENFKDFMEPYKQVKQTRDRAQMTIHDHEFGKQINLLCTHVNRCLQLLRHIYVAQGDCTPVAELYKMLWNGAKLPAAPRTPKATPGGSTGGTVNERVLDLALVWREGLRPEHVPLLARRDQEDVLAQLKVSYAVYLCKSGSSSRPVRDAFELDLPTMCDMKARLSGKTRTYPAHVAARFRPAFSYQPPLRPLSQAYAVPN